MQRWVRVPPMVIIGVLAATAMTTTTETATAQAGAAAVARAPTPSAVHSSAGDLELTLDGDGAVVVDPGASVRRSFVVENHSTSLRLTVRLSAVDASARPNGDIQYTNDASATGPARWVTLSDLIATLEPGATVRGSFTIAPPADADPSNVVAGLVARIDHAVRASDNTEVPRRDSIELPVPIEVKGAPTALVSVARVAAVKDGGREYLEITFQNGGATANTMVGEVSVLGSHPHTEPVRAVAAALAHTSARVPFTMPDGAKTVRVSVETQDAGGDRASWIGNVGGGSAPAPTELHTTTRKSATAPGSGGAGLPWLPPVLVGAVFLAAAMWLAAEMRRTRRRRVAMIRAAALAVPPEPAWPPQIGLLASRLDALVDAIDRLVVRIGEPAPPTPPVVPPAVRTLAPSLANPPVPPRSPVETGAILYAPAAAPRGVSAPRVSPDDGEYPYDWPTQEQLDKFETQRVSPNDQT